MTGEELFDKHSMVGGLKYNPMGQYLRFEHFTEALTEYRESIIKKIEEKIKERKLLNQIFDTDAAWMAKIHNEEIKEAGIIALTEIREKIEEMK